MYAYNRVSKRNGRLCALQYRELLKTCAFADVVLVVGADNYDKVYSMFSFMHRLNVCLRRASKANLILYDCSLSGDDIDQANLDDFSLFDSITVRETTTLNALKKHNVLAGKVVYCPDPAFLLDASPCVLKKGWFPGNMIGVNASPLVMKNRYGDHSTRVYEAYQKLLEDILRLTDQNVLLIPHVMQGKDLSILKRLYEPYTDNPRVGIIDDEGCSSGQIKFCISQCSAFVGARTHSTIAAYSSCVPTLVIGYSIKSYAIARDLFGKHEGYVLPCDQIRDENTITNAFFAIYADREQIKYRLEQMMPDYVAKARQFIELFNKRDQEVSGND